MPLTNKQAKVAQASAYAGSAGFAGGLIYAFVKKKKFWGYVGYSILFSLIASSAGGVAAAVVVREM